MILFTTTLLRWHKQSNTRQMPWKGEKDPYKIWLSEIILQQTRVEQGWDYYEKFIRHYPSIQDLAKAKDEKVFKLWEGLGYYNRCKNLLHTARYIMQNFGGNFPMDYKEILSLKGIGPYTAAAICSFAYNQPYAVVDGNVFRVLSRVFGIDCAIDIPEGKEIFTQLAEKYLAAKEPAAYNQAIMDFGATVCKPANPLCAGCVMHSFCIAYQKGIVNQLPVKEKILTKKIRYFTWFNLKVNEHTYIHKRTAGDIWQNLHEFYLVETDGPPGWDADKVSVYIRNVFNEKAMDIRISGQKEQQLTHQKIKGILIEVVLPRIPVSLKGQLWLKKTQRTRLAFPKLLNDFLAEAL